MENGKWKVSLALSKNFQLSTLNFQLKSGFSFVELLVVITIMGILMSITAASYSNLRRSTNLKNAALQLKSDIRYAQNKALAGDKRVDTPNPNLRCPKVDADGRPKYTLVGWYLTIRKGSGDYEINTSCRDATDPLASDVADVPKFKTIDLPQGVTVSALDGTENRIRILFRPLVNGATIHSFSSPPFYISGVFRPEIVYTPPFKITLTSDSGDSYQVIIQPSGEISEKKL